VNVWQRAALENARRDARLDRGAGQEAFDVRSKLGEILGAAVRFVGRKLAVDQLLKR
jgi:hypothetical protein